MKKSRIAKIALMGASITALAATLTTSTYAWYVSNKQADVTGGTGSTGAAGSDGSVLVGWTDGADTYYKSIDFADDTDATRNALDPIHYASGFYGINTDGTKPTSVSTSYIQFDVWVKTGSGVAVTPTINLSVTGSNTQIAYVGASGYVQAKAFDANATYYKKGATTYSVVSIADETAFNDATATLYTRSGSGAAGDPFVYSAAATYDANATYYTASTQYTETTVADADAFAAGEFYLQYTNAIPSNKEKGQTFFINPLKAIWVQQVVDGGATTYFCQDTTESGANAHAYYTAVTGYTPWATSTESSGLGTISTTAGVGKKVTYTIYLDGGDVDCFNSCAGYDINFDLTFSIA